jgi:protocatechuate 3,4-dioxygenase beta subunit
VLLGLGETSSEIVIEAVAAHTVQGKVIVAGAKPLPCAQGSVTLDDKARHHRVSASIQGGTVTLRAVRPGSYEPTVECARKLSAESYPKVVVASTDVSGLEWSVSDGLAIRGTVVDDSGAPIRDATVSAELFGGDPRGRQGRRDWNTETMSEATKQDGAFTIVALAPGKYRLRPRAPDRPELTSPVEVSLGPGDLTGVKLVMSGGGSIDGIVTDEDGTPVSGVEVSARGKVYSWNNATTRDDGTFEKNGLTPGDYRVTASRSWWGEEMRGPGQSDDDVHGASVTVRAGQTSHVKLTVEREKGAIHGSVVDSAGKPVTDAFVIAQRESDSAAASSAQARQETRWFDFAREPALTDQAGTFTIDKLTEGSYAVRAYRRGGGDAIAEHVKVGTTVKLTIPVTGSIAGTVAAANGTNPDEIEVLLLDRKRGFYREETFFHTQGAFTMRELPSGDFDLSVTAPEGDAMLKLSLAEGEKKDGVALTLTARAKVRGQVVSLDDGTPVAGMSVRLMLPHSNAASSGGDDDVANVTDATGHFEIADAPTGKVYVWGWPTDWEGSDYGFCESMATVAPGDNDLPPLQAPRRRVKSPQRPGDLGFTTKQQEPDVEPEQQTIVVAVVRPGGPAAVAGMKVGDVIVSVDGHDVTSVKSLNFRTLAQIPEGATITFGLASGGKVTITAAAPL